jgi:hypothetical protein
MFCDELFVKVQPTDPGSVLPGQKAFPDAETKPRLLLERYTGTVLFKSDDSMVQKRAEGGSISSFAVLAPHTFEIVD